MPPAIKGSNLLSTVQAESPFYGYTHVFLPYCSNDLWSGNTVKTVYGGADSSSDGNLDSTARVYLRGKRIFEVGMPKQGSACSVLADRGCFLVKCSFP
jgi:hypothetical protein